MYQDKTLVCRDCGQDFIFSAGEQEFFSTKGLQNEPGRCPSCRTARRTSGGSHGGARGGGGGSREMTTVTCSSCGQPAQVPFVPRNDKPVYCSDCFSKQRSYSGAGSRY